MTVDFQKNLGPSPNLGEKKPQWINYIFFLSLCLVGTQTGSIKENEAHRSHTRSLCRRQWYTAKWTLWHFPIIVPLWNFFNKPFLKVMGNEKRGGSGCWKMFKDGFGPWRLMSVAVARRLAVRQDGVWISLGTLDEAHRCTMSISGL